MKDNKGFDTISDRTPYYLFNGQISFIFKFQFLVLKMQKINQYEFV